MKKLHFYKLRSRLGLINFPNGTHEYNVGVENGSDAILDSQFLQKFSDYKIDEYIFPTPEEIDASQYYQELANHSENAIKLINSTLAPDETQVVIGGDHSVGFPSLASVLQRYNPADVGMILIDSHGEMHLHSTSPSGNFHGMWLRPLVDHFDLVEIDRLVPTKLPVQNLLYIGILDLESAERDFLEANKITVINQEMLADKTAVLAQIKLFASKFKHLHISLDVDAFDKSVVTATGIPGNPGLMPEEINHLLGYLATTYSYSFDIVELNASKPDATESIKIAQETLQRML